MDNDYPIDLDEIVRVLSSADVIVMRFLLIPERLLIDPRTNEQDGPLVKVVQPAGSAEERFRELRRLRPRFKLPDRITVIHWPKFIARLDSAGVWAALEKRTVSTQFPDSEAMLREAWQQLNRLERQAIRRAITGEGYRTIWQRGA